MKTFLLVLLLPNICLAATQSELIEIIQVRCDFTNNQISFDIREDCMLDYVNCSVGKKGIDIKDLDKCVANKREKK